MSTPPLPHLSSHVPTPPPQPFSPERFVLRRTTYYWLALLVVGYLVPTLFFSGRHLRAGREHSLSATDFERYVEAETRLRYALPPSGIFDDGKDPLGEIRTTYRQLALSTGNPNMARRVLILDHVRGKRLDQKFLTQLQPLLVKSDKTDIQSDTEVRLWRAIYGQSRIAAANLPEDTALIRAMHLRYLENQALADLYRAAGEKKQADFYTKQMGRAARRFRSRDLTVKGTWFLGILVGLVLLVIYVVTAIDRHWYRIFRVATRPQKLDWADLIDVFVFYLMLVHGISDIVSIFSLRYLATPSVETILAISAGVYVASGGGAMLYLVATARRRGVTLADIGLHTRNGFSDILYGIGGYCAVLPLTIAMGLISRQIFGHRTNTTPNPILPLMTSESNPLAQVAIFALVAVAAPFFEELFFRGALFSGLRTRFNWFPSAIISAALFAMVHPMQDWLPIFALGLGLATVREMRQSLVPGMVMHLLQNSLSFLTLWIAFSK